MFSTFPVESELGFQLSWLNTVISKLDKFSEIQGPFQGVWKVKNIFFRQFGTYVLRLTNRTKDFFFAPPQTTRNRWEGERVLTSRRCVWWWWYLFLNTHVVCPSHTDIRKRMETMRLMIQEQLKPLFRDEWVTKWMDVNSLTRWKRHDVNFPWLWLESLKVFGIGIEDGKKIIQRLGGTTGWQQEICTFVTQPRFFFYDTQRPFCHLLIPRSSTHYTIMVTDVTHKKIKKRS